ncbi:MAG: hypothetical protein ACREKK_09280, partial [Candidatus Methylomirabilales bacterium]
GKIAPEALAGLERYSYMASVTFNGRLTPPFRLRGVSVEELWGEHRRPEAVAALEEAIASNVGCRPVAEVLAELATLDQRILAYLRRRRSSSGGLQDLPYAEIDEDGDEEQP